MDGAAEDKGTPRRFEQEEDGEPGRPRLLPAKLLLRGRAPAGARLAGTEGPANAAVESRVSASTITPSETRADDDDPAALIVGDAG